MRFEVPVDLDAERLDRAVAVLGDISRSAARTIVERGGVLRAGEPALSPRVHVVVGDVLEFEIPEVDDRLIPVQVDYGTVYEDEHILIVDKPAGLTVHPGAATGDKTLAAGLLFDHPSIEGVGQPERWGIVHRLDRATSGLLVVALTAEAYDVLTAMMRAREVKRVYQALVRGIMAIPRGTVDAPIGPDPNRPTRRAMSPYGKHAVTHYRRTASWPIHDVSMLEVTLETGRTHQIRVHLSGIGNPVLGRAGNRSPWVAWRANDHRSRHDLLPPSRPYHRPVVHGMRATDLRRMLDSGCSRPTLSAMRCSLRAAEDDHGTIAGTSHCGHRSGDVRFHRGGCGDPPPVGVRPWAME